MYVSRKFHVRWYLDKSTPRGYCNHVFLFLPSSSSPFLILNSFLILIPR